MNSKIKKTIIITISIICTIIMISAIYYHLPFQIKYRSEIKFGNKLIEKIEEFRMQNNSIPRTTDYEVLQSFGFEHNEVFLPIYQKINTTDYMLIYSWGFDPPWLYYFSKTKKWNYGFDFPKKNTVKIYFPDWLEGVWNNSGESNTNNFIYWTFSDNEIIHEIGIPARFKEVLNEKYSDYEKITSYSDNEFQINFIKENDTIIYNFRLEKLEWTTNRALSYSLIINGTEVQKRITDNVGSILINQEDFLQTYFDNLRAKKNDTK